MNTNKQSKGNKPKLLMLKGLPASGKSTYAKELVEKGYTRVNKDDLRLSLHNGAWSKSNENSILLIRDLVIKDALISGKSVVVDDTNFVSKHQATFEKIANELNAKFEVLFIDTPLEECIKRNEKRANKVPVNVIYEMHNRYIAPLRDNKKVEYNEELEECVVVDVDGTLAHMGDRNPYDASRAMEDTIDDAVCNIVNMAYGHGYRILVLTGRHSGHLQVTVDWLNANGVNFDEIYCRNEGDVRPDTEVKKELYENHIKNRLNVKYIIDDRPSVCRMWRAEGLKVLQVGDPHVEF